MSIISGDAVSAVGDMEEKDVVDECVKVLRELFKEQVLTFGVSTVCRGTLLHSVCVRTVYAILPHFQEGCITI